jgi:DNA mismatch repair protein MutS
MSATTKPMYRKYYDVWSAHRDKYGAKVALLYQVGGFFEIYDTENLTTGTTQANIREIAELCQLSLTVHDAGDGFQTLFGGFPEHAIGKFEKILVQAGYTVVVVVQRKGTTGAVEERVVDHISSPGCYVDNGSIKERRLVGIVLESLQDGAATLRRVYWAATALDLATGRIWFVEGVDRDRLHQFLCIHPPSELVLWSDGLAGASSLMDSLKAACSAVHVRCLGASSVAVDESILGTFWSPVRRLDWMPRMPQARRCLAALMNFAGDHMPSALKVLDLPEAWVPTGEVRLGNAALEQLGLLSLRSSDDKQSLLGMMDQCRSVGGRRLMRSRLMRPITDVVELNRRLDLVDRCRAVSEADAVITERGLRSLYDLSRLWRRLELGTATMNDMGCLLRSYQAVRDLSAVWSGPEEIEMFVGWVAVRWNLDAVTALVRDGGSVPVTQLPWASGARPAADAAFAAGRAIREEAVALCDSWSSIGKGERLYLDDAEGGGFRVTGTKRRISAALAVLRDEGDTTAVTSTYKTSATLETAGLNNISARHREWYAAWVTTWMKEWSSACAAIVEKGQTAHAALEAWCAQLDVAWTTARMARDWLWTRPVFIDGDEGHISVDRLRHPILERLTTVPYVPHSVTLGGDGDIGILLYGMNASGKSSLMKALGLATLLAQTGFPVPAASMRLAPFTAIFTRILGNDNLWAGLSSFAVEMTEFREILRFADERSLILGDELCSGTESLSATALVAAGVEMLTRCRSKFVFATHLHELATMPDIASLKGVQAMHLKVHYDSAADRLVYDRELAPGSGSALYGLEVCRALDLPAGFLDRATALRKALAGDVAATQSRYSSGAVVNTCHVCGSTDRLESHHIRPQADAAAATAEGFYIHGAGNLVCLCAVCHDDHHAGRLIIRGWSDTSKGRVLNFSKEQGTAPSNLEPTVIAWVREQRRLKIRIPTIRRMAKQLFGVEISDAEIRGTH